LYWYFNMYLGDVPGPDAAGRCGKGGREPPLDATVVLAEPPVLVEEEEERKEEEAHLAISVPVPVSSGGLAPGRLFVDGRRDRQVCVGQSLG
jgi:hypothetical protein